MEIRRAYALALFAALPLAAACTGSPNRSSPLPPQQDAASGTQRQAPHVVSVCPDRGESGVAYCTALMRTDTGPSNEGYSPAQLHAAYNLPMTGGSGQTVAVIDAFDDPDVEGDLYTYRNSWGLPVCSTLNGCFKRLNEKGKAGPYPPADRNWATEISIDVEVVSAICPDCNIMLLESSSSRWKDLEASVNMAAKLGANVIGNSYGGFGGADPVDFDHPGTIITGTASGTLYNKRHTWAPANFPTVVAVGGTTLLPGSGSRGWTESAYNQTGSACSRFTKPAWQTDKGCRYRTANDVAADADPSTGVAIFNSYTYSGWNEFGGGSVANDIIAGVYGLAGNASQLNAAQSLYLPGNATFLNDITTGHNGFCQKTYLCTAGPGYDGPTGNGTPNGVGAF
jgi:subtilase family serine protease